MLVSLLRSLISFAFSSDIF